jgi:hypothetical protein
MTESVRPDPSTSDPRDPLAFVAVASASRRHDGWTPDRQRAFIDALARIGIVSAAARSVRMSAKSAYALRKRAGEASGFVCAWNAALRQGRAQVLDLSIERAFNGEIVPVFYRGLQIGQRVRHDNRLLMAALRVMDPVSDRAAHPFTGEVE